MNGRKKYTKALEAEKSLLIKQVAALEAECRRLQNENEGLREEHDAQDRNILQGVRVADQETARADKAESALQQMTASAEIERLDKEAARRKLYQAQVRIRELEGALRLMLSALPEGWTVPLLYSDIAAQCRAALRPEAQQKEGT